MLFMMSLLLSVDIFPCLSLSYPTGIYHQRELMSTSEPHLNLANQGHIFRLDRPGPDQLVQA